MYSLQHRAFPHRELKTRECPGLVSNPIVRCAVRALSRCGMEGAEVLGQSQTAVDSTNFPQLKIRGEKIRVKDTQDPSLLL